MTQQHGLTWGTLDLVSTTPTADGYVITAMDGSDFGNPVPITETIASLLTDGSLVDHTRTDNRTIVLRLQVTAPESASPGVALAKAEAAIMSQSGDRISGDEVPELIWTPPIDGAEPSVYDVVFAWPERDSEGWDEGEVLHERRNYVLTLTCLPFARPETSVVVATTAGAATVVDTCDSDAAWSHDPSATLTATSGYLQLQKFTTTSTTANRLNLPSTAGPYLRMSLTLVSGDAVVFNVGDAGFTTSSPAPVLATSASAIPGATDYYIAAPEGVGSIQLRPTRSVSGTITLRIHQIDSVEMVPVIGTARQQARRLEVGGSAPTQAALRVADATPAALGTEILVYTGDHGFVPALRPWRSASAAVTADAAMVSGSRNTLTSTMTFQIPAGSLAEATHALLARLSVTVAGTLSWSARMVNSSGTTTVGSSVTATGSASVPITSGYEVIALGSLVLPVVDVEGTQMVELVLTGTANMTFDDGWLFNLDDGALTWIKDSDSLTWVEIRSPEIDSARPSVFGGLAAAGTDGVCIDWKCESFGTHRFSPDGVYTFVVTSTSLLATSSGEFYRRYHSHVYDESA